jgi:alpha-glucosidase
MTPPGGPLADAHHDGSARYVTSAAPTLGDAVTVFVTAPADVRRVYARVVRDGEPHFAEAVVDRRTPDGETWWRADVAVHHPVTRYRFLLDAGGGRTRWLTALGTAGHDVPDAFDFRLVAYAAPPAWAGDAIVYQVFPDRFARSAAADGRPVPDWAVPCAWDTPVVPRGPRTPRQLYGGDLDGIAERLDHVQALGADTLYLTPVFPARSNHRYDAAAFDRVDPLLGGEPALGRLADAVRARGMRLLGDVTTNHCGDTHPWFTAAAADAGAPEREMFYFDAHGGYESWLGVGSLPKLNWGSPELRRRFLNGPDAVVARWLEYFDGWRVDVANMTGRHGADDHNRDVAAALRRAATAARPDAVLLAEHGHDFTGDLDADGWAGTMNYAGFTRPVWSWLRAPDLDAPDFLGVPGGLPRRGGGATVATMRLFSALVSWRALTHSWTLLGSHDTPRVRTVVGDSASGEVAAGLLATLPGVPMVFAGDELGLTGGNGEGSRTPMPWDRPWDVGTLVTYRRLLGLRRNCAPLRHGGLRWLHVDDDTLVFLRETADERLVVAARRSGGGLVRLVLPGPADNVYGGAPAVGGDGALTVPGDGPMFQVWRLSGTGPPRGRPAGAAA